MRKMSFSLVLVEEGVGEVEIQEQVQVVEVEQVDSFIIILIE